MKILFLIFIFLTTVLNIQACMYKKKQIPPQDTIIPGHWNDAQYTRYVDRGCECGEHQHNVTGDPNWNLFIGHAKVNPRLDKIQVDPVCIGTIITSNLIATVLRCVQTTNETIINVYHAWMPERYSEGVIDKSDIIVSTMSSGEGERFPVEEINFATGALQHTLVGRAKNTDVHNDLLLLRINATNEFLGKFPQRPICLPRMNSLNFSSKLGTYYGVGEGQHPDNFSSDYHYGVIDSKEFCDDESSYKKKDGENSKEQFQSLCLRWRKTEEMPDTYKAMHGGSLFIQSLKGGTAFIAGIEYRTDFDRFRGVPFMFPYFTNILPMIKYIEYQANKHESKWCYMKNDLVLPEPVKTSNHTGTDFEGPEIPEEIAENSWWCAEHQDILDKKAKTDWTRFADAKNAFKDELYKCNKETPDTDSITFFQKGKEESIGKINYWDHSDYDRENGKCYEINKEWAAITDIVSSAICVVILEKCEDEAAYETIGYYEDRERVGPLEIIHRVQVNPGEKISLDWFGLARRATAYRPCMDEIRDSLTPVMFYSSNGTKLDSYSPWELCKCNNLNLSLGIPAQVVNEGDCLELYENENCTGWIRTVPGGRSFHSENLNVNNPNDKNPIKYPQVKSFSRCSIFPNCYDLNTMVFQMVLKNKGVKDWKIPYKKHTITKQVVIHPDEKTRLHEVERDLSVINGTFKIQLIRISSRPNMGTYFIPEDWDAISIPNMHLGGPINGFLHDAYENVIHSRGSEPGEYIGHYWITDSKDLPLTIEMWRPAKCTVYEWISAANVEFPYYKKMRIHARMAGGASVPEDKLKEIIAKDLGYNKVEKCDDDGCWIRIDGKFTMTLAGGEPQIGTNCDAECGGRFNYKRGGIHEGVTKCWKANEIVR